MEKKIDFVIAWVDGNDLKWRERKKEYQTSASTGLLSKWNDSQARYRDWELLRYWFRGVEKFAPWVNRIHFVTCGQKPNWLNTEHPKLNLVNHEDYIPSEYLPTFSSHCIELNLHRIQGLEEQFVYFNDDMFLTKTVAPEDFFRKGLPCDAAVLCPVNMVQNGIRAEINDLYVINDFFEKNEVIKKNPYKWFAPCYGKMLLRTICTLPFSRFRGFYVYHVPCSYLKSTYQRVWKEVPEILHETCKHRFRSTTDVNQWLFEYWQYAEGRFAPRSPKCGIMEEGAESLSKICKYIEEQQYKMICWNDSPDISDFENAKSQVQRAFESILPTPSSFEIEGRR